MREVEKFIQTALEASIYIAPRDHGLTVEELNEIGRHAGFQVGEIGDALERSRKYRGLNQQRLVVERMRLFKAASFEFAFDPDYRSFDAFEFVHRYLLDLQAKEGWKRARAPRSVIVECAIADGLSEHEVEVAIALLFQSGILKDHDGELGYTGPQTEDMLPSKQQKRRSDYQTRPELRRLYPIVKDQIGRRTDGRASSPEPLDAFAGVLRDLGHSRFKLWWRQTVGELRRCDDRRHPTSRVVLAAALGEAALAFVVPHGRKVGTMTSKTFEKEAKQWKFIDLIKGGRTRPNDKPEVAIYDDAFRDRCLEVNRLRQRIHAGFLMGETETGPIPDLKPEAAREAVQTVELLVRKIIDWLSRYPPTTGS